MNIILHIGTHKTGTSSLQNFFTTNKKELLSQGISYALGKDSIRNINSIASKLAMGRKIEVKKFFDQAHADAVKNNAECILFSAESFYAMTGFFYLLNEKKVDDYWELEHSFVSDLHECIGEKEVKLVIYVRRQAEFLESIYNQFVKQAPGFKGDITEFHELAENILNYDKHISIWKETFSGSRISVNNFEQEKIDLIARFLLKELNIKSKNKFKFPRKNINERLNPYVLSFKKIINNIDMPLAESYVISREIWKLTCQSSQDGQQWSLLTNKQQEGLAKKYFQGNRNIFFDGNSQLFSNPDHKYDMRKKYKGLDIENGIIIYYLYQKAIRSPLIKFEIFFRKTIRLLERLSFFQLILYPFRKVFNAYRLASER